MFHTKEQFYPNYQTQLRIRKLTPRECQRLMGFHDVFTDRMNEAGLSKAAQYHVWGDSIAVPVLMGIFGKLTDMTDNDITNLIYNYMENLQK